MTEEQKAIHMLKSYAGMTHRLTDNQGRPKLDQAIETVLNLIQKQQEEIEKKDKIIDLMAEDKYENINMIQMANIGKEVNYDPTKLFSGIPDEEVIKIIKQYFEKKVEGK